MATESPPQAQTVVVNVPRQSQALPALVNIFLPGVGQLIQGRPIAWLAWWAAFLFVNMMAVALLLVGESMTFTLGVLVIVVCNPALWLACIIESAVWSPKQR